MYRAVKDINSDKVIAIATDESQSGSYHDVGVWCDFIFESIPIIPQEVLDYALENHIDSVFKIVDNTIVCKTILELS